MAYTKRALGQRGNAKADSRETCGPFIPQKARTREEGR